MSVASRHFSLPGFLPKKGDSPHFRKKGTVPIFTILKSGCPFFFILFSPMLGVGSDFTGLGKMLIFQFFKDATT